MRWERLFDDLEAGALDDAALDRDALAADLADEEWATTPWTELVGATADLEVAGVGRVRGRVVHHGPDVLGLRTALHDVLVATSAVRQILGEPTGPAGPSAPGRLGWRPALRALRDDLEPVEVVDREGRRLTGAVEVVGQDFVTVRRPDGRATTVVLAAVAAVRVAR